MPFQLREGPYYPQPAEQAEQILADAVKAVTDAGDMLNAHLGGETADLRQALGRLAEALQHLAFLEAWDVPPDPSVYRLWDLMARRHLPVQGEMFREEYVPGRAATAAT